jgi:hypothetical protein
VQTNGFCCWYDCTQEDSTFEPNNTAEVLRAYRAREIQALGLEKAERFKKELKSTLNIPTTDESDTMSVQSDEIIEKVTPSWTRKTSLITVEPYSDKSFVVRGDTFEHKIVFAKFDGKWNKNLTDKKTGSRFGAWIFSNSKRVVVDKFLLELDHISDTGLCGRNKGKSHLHLHNKVANGFVEWRALY